MTNCPYIVIHNGIQFICVRNHGIRGGRHRIQAV